MWFSWTFFQVVCFCFSAASGYEKLLLTVKHPIFQTTFIRITLMITIKKQLIKNGRIVTKVGIYYFLHPKPYKHLYLSPDVILMILKFSPRLDPQTNLSKKAETNKPFYLVKLIYKSYWGCSQCVRSKPIFVCVVAEATISLWMPPWCPPPNFAF